MPKLPSCKSKEAVRVFKRHGWSLARYIDDHFILKNKERDFFCQFQIIIL